VYDEELRRHGIRAGQLTILALVATLEQLSPRQISVYLGLDPSTVSRNISRMCTSGWLTTIPGTDSRSHEVIATPKGRRLLEAAFPAWRTAQKQAEELLGGRGFRTVARLADDLPWDERSV
jgi:DNA-binding MarR family transcriptional regulator